MGAPGLLLISLVYTAIPVGNVWSHNVVVKFILCPILPHKGVRKIIIINYNGRTWLQHQQCINMSQLTITFERTIALGPFFLLLPSTLSLVVIYQWTSSMCASLKPTRAHNKLIVRGQLPHMTPNLGQCNASSTLRTNRNKCFTFVPPSCRCWPQCTAGPHYLLHGVRWYLSHN